MHVIHYNSDNIRYMSMSSYKLIMALPSRSSATAYNVIMEQSPIPGKNGLKTHFLPTLLSK